MKKIVVLLLVVVLAVAGFAGCSAPAGNDSADESGAKGEKKSDKNDESPIVVWTQASADTPEGKMFEDRIIRYNEANPDKTPVVIENITRAGAGSGYIDRLNASITAGDVPDIFTLDGPDVGAYVDSGIIGSIDGLMSEGFKEGFTDAMIGQGTVDGEFYAMGYQDSGVVLMYNEDMINVLPDDLKSLVPAYDEDWTWDQFVDLAEKVDDYAKTSDDPAFAEYETCVSLMLTDIRKGAYELGTYYFTPLIWGNGGRLVAEDGVTVDGTLNSEENVEALAKYARLFAKPVAITEESDKVFHTGKAPFAVAGFWYITDLVDNYPDLKFRTVRYPKMSDSFDGLYTPSGSWAFVRSAFIEDEARLAQVVEVMEWLNNDEAAEEYYLANGAVPGRVAKVDVISTDTDNEYYNQAWEVLKYQVSNTNKARPVSPGYPYLSETFAKDIILRISQNNTTDEATIKQYLDEATAKIEAEFMKFSK